jgi:hypothetical protein
MQMRRYNFALREQPDSNGVMEYSIEIAALTRHSFHAESGLMRAVKQYQDEKSYKRDIEADFTSQVSGELKCNQVVYLTDDRAKYYGWPVDTISADA